jgi:superkiller protein 3
VPEDSPALDITSVALVNNLDPTEEAIQLWSQHAGPGATLGRAGALLFAGDAEKSLEAYRSIVGSNLDLEARLGVAHSLLSLGDQQKALEEALAVTEAYPNCLYGWLLQARLEAALGYIDEALAATEEVLKQAQAWPEVWNLKGILLGAKGSWREAEGAFTQATNLRDDYPVGWNNLGVAYLRLARFEEAIKALSKALTLEPHYPEALSNLGVALQRKGEHEKALKAFRGATVLSEAPAFQLNLATSLETSGEREEALGRIDAILARRSDYAPAIEAKKRLEDKG